MPPYKVSAHKLSVSTTACHHQVTVDMCPEPVSYQLPRRSDRVLTTHIVGLLCSCDDMMGRLTFESAPFNTYPGMLARIHFAHLNTLELTRCTGTGPWLDVLERLAFPQLVQLSLIGSYVNIIRLTDVITASDHICHDIGTLHL
ncbi:hypothetical protein SCP_0102930 [Sparassis crispa]|uniref:Uncharacterized protein n=1 Tax=Sparassis crispa TaxID=139825 RepID=A0A401G5H9_9APHY|nr:hypothetical protein SCP_0102930 [Sparassis crispa]GBE77419.1 hypothetical protein SCP_0102930 [Sparassis crispa]